MEKINKTINNFVEGLNKFVFKCPEREYYKLKSPQYRRYMVTPNGFGFNIQWSALYHTVSCFVDNGKGTIILSFSFSPRDNKVRNVRKFDAMYYDKFMECVKANNVKFDTADSPTPQRRELVYVRGNIYMKDKLRELLAYFGAEDVDKEDFRDYQKYYSIDQRTKKVVSDDIMSPFGKVLECYGRELKAEDC